MVLWDPIPPLRRVPGIVVYPDSDPDSLIYYYAPEQPGLARTIGAGGKEEPDFSLTILPGAGGERRALLTATVELAVSPDLLKKAQRALSEPRREADLRPLRFEAGSEVSIYVLDAATRDFFESAKPETVPDSSLVLSATARTTPGLFGTNRSVFQALLSAAGGELVTEQISDPDEPGLPVVVSYRLIFSALRPASAVSAKVDWESVERELRTSFEIKLLALEVDLEDRISKLESNGAITFTQDDYLVGPEAEPESRRARAEITNLIKTVFFDRIRLEAGDREKPALFRFRKDARKLTDSRVYDFSFKSLQTVLRIHQASGGLLGALRPFAESARKRVFEVPLNAPEDTKRRLIVRSLQDLGPESEVHRIEVQVKYGGRAEPPAELNAEQPEQIFQWQRNVSSESVQYAYTAFFRPRSGFPSKLASSWETLDSGEYLFLTPAAELYDLERVVFALQADFPWDEYLGAAVEAELTGDTPAKETFRLTAGRRSVEWAFPVQHGRKASLEYRISYLDRDGNEIGHTEPQTIAGGAVEIPAPPATKRTVRVVLETADPQGVDSVVVRLWTEDVTNEKPYENRRDGPLSGPLEFSHVVRGDDAQRKKLCANAEVEYDDGAMKEIPFAETRGLTLRMRESGSTPRLITFHPASDFFGRAAGRTFEIAFCGPSDSAERTKPLTREQLPPEFGFGYSASTENSWLYRWRLVVTEPDGFRRELPWESGETSSVTLPASFVSD